MYWISSDNNSLFYCKTPVNGDFYERHDKHGTFGAFLQSEMMRICWERGIPDNPELKADIVDCVHGVDGQSGNGRGRFR